MTLRQAPIHHLQPNLNRIIEAVLFVVREAERRKIAVTQYVVVKTIFLADKGHLNKYGRPITYDNYVAMENGPVPSVTYNVLKEHPKVVARYGKPFPWHRREAPELGIRCFAFERPSRGVNEDVLSPSDMQELEAALQTVNLLGFKQIRKLTHDDPAYRAAWQRDGDRRQYPISYSLLFEVPNEKLAAELAFLSKHI